MEGVGARGFALKLFVQLLGCSRSGGAVVCAGAAEPSGTRRSVRSGREEPQSEEGEEEEEKEEERGPRWRLGAREPGSWTAEAAVCADSAPAARAPQARASAPGGSAARLGAEDSAPPRSPSRAGPGRASETMNFLLSWVHWSLALLLYLHHAKWSQAAPMAEGEHKPHEGESPSLWMGSLSPQGMDGEACLFFSCLWGMGRKGCRNMEIKRGQMSTWRLTLLFWRTLSFLLRPLLEVGLWLCSSTLSSKMLLGP